ncbi:MAG: hypothetical protein NT154_14095 [Verrucomicrobia bacterium]|nr:hypothetical protein [Verrucomicrobiota bacterium]
MNTKTNLTSLARSLAKIATSLLVTLSTSTLADCYWAGLVSSDWSNPSNWYRPGLYSTNAGAGNAIINSGANPCVVSHAGNYTADGVYVSIGVGLSILPGGQLTIPTTFLTGVWGNSPPVNITGGNLNIGGYLNIGAGGYAGPVNIAGGTVTAGALSINSSLSVSGGALSAGNYLDVGGTREARPP